MSMPLWQRLSLCFAALLVACFVAAAGLHMSLSMRQTQLVEQQLLHQLATHIAAETQGMPGGPQEPDEARVAAFAERLRLINPGIELYVLDAAGRILHHHPPVRHLQRAVVDLGPVRDFIAGKPPPLLGDDPLSADGRKVFSAAVWPGAGSASGYPGYPGYSGYHSGYLYAVLQGSAYDRAASNANRDAVLRTAMWSVGLVAPLGMLAGLTAFRLVTRPLSELTREVEALERKSRGAALDPDASASTAGGDEIAILRQAFSRLADTNESQRERLSQQDQLRRELMAGISHDLRTPLASMQGYLETLLLKSAQLSSSERDHYLRTALSQCQAVGRLAGELLDLARLELGVVKPASERFSLVDLVHDVVQKLALASAARQQRVDVTVAPGVPDVLADIGMIERVLTNLLDNAIRHSPDDGSIRVTLTMRGERVEIEVADSGPGIPDALLDRLFEGPTARRANPAGSGLGLAIVRQILRLHGDDIRVQTRAGEGAIFVFGLPGVGL